MNYLLETWEQSFDQGYELKICRKSNLSWALQFYTRAVGIFNLIVTSYIRQKMTSHLTNYYCQLIESTTIKSWIWLTFYCTSQRRWTKAMLHDMIFLLCMMRLPKSGKLLLQRNGALISGKELRNKTEAQSVWNEHMQGSSCWNK